MRRYRYQKRVRGRWGWAGQAVQHAGCCCCTSLAWPHRPRLPPPPRSSSRTTWASTCAATCGCRPTSKPACRPRPAAPAARRMPHAPGTRPPTSAPSPAPLDQALSLQPMPIPPQNRYYTNVLVDSMKEDHPYDSIPNFTVRWARWVRWAISHPPGSPHSLQHCILAPQLLPLRCLWCHRACTAARGAPAPSPARPPRLFRRPGAATRPPARPCCPLCQAADIVRILGIGRNEYIATMVQVHRGLSRGAMQCVLAAVHDARHPARGAVQLPSRSAAAPRTPLAAASPPPRAPAQAKSKKLLWRMNKGIVRDLLPPSPLNIQIGVCLGEQGGQGSRAGHRGAHGRALRGGGAWVCCPPRPPHAPRP